MFNKIKNNYINKIVIWNLINKKINQKPKLQSKL